jgi:hypothetical protein
MVAPDYQPTVPSIVLGTSSRYNQGRMFLAGHPIRKMCIWHIFRIGNRGYCLHRMSWAVSAVRRRSIRKGCESSRQPDAGWQEETLYNSRQYVHLVMVVQTLDAGLESVSCQTNRQFSNDPPRSLRSRAGSVLFQSCAAEGCLAV